MLSHTIHRMNGLKWGLGLVSLLLSFSVRAGGPETPSAQPQISSAQLREVLEALLSLEDHSGRFGPEWTFTNDQMVESGREITVLHNAQNPDPEARKRADLADFQLRNQILDKWIAAIRKNCPSCQIEVSEGNAESLRKARVIYGEGRWIEIAKDPWVFEVTGSPFTTDDLLQNSQVMENILWKSALEASLKPHWRVGGGHRHIEDSTFFKGDLRTYVNFFTFIANNPEMFMGPLGFDFTNSPPLALLADEQKQAFVQVLHDVEKGQITTIPDFKKAIKERVYTGTFFYTVNQQLRPWKHHAVNMAHEVTTEIRSFRPQADLASEMAIDTILLAIRNYAGKHQGLIPYVQKNYRNQVDVSMDRGMQTYTLKISPAFVHKQFVEMLGKIGLDKPFFRNLSGDDFEKQLAAEKGGPQCSRVFRSR